MRIAFIGLGNMGRHMAANLQKAGHEVVVHDMRRAAAEGHLANGARWANSAAEAAQGAELILTSLPGPKQVEEVALGEGGILQGAAKGAVYADLSTSSPTLIRRIYGVFAEQGIHVLDAPVSGGPVGAERAHPPGDGRRRRGGLQPRPPGPARHRRQGQLHRGDRRRRDRQALPQHDELLRQPRAGRGLHARRQGRPRA